MKQCRTVCVNLALLGMLVLMPGCVGLLFVGGVAAAGGAGAYIYARGTYKGMLAAPLFQSDQALRAVCARASLHQVRRTCNGFRCSYKFEDNHGNSVFFRLRSVTLTTTQIYIHVGRFGDKEASRQLLQAVERQLQNTSGS